MLNITRLALFGSTVRDESIADNDIDILVSFDAQQPQKNILRFNRYIDYYAPLDRAYSTTTNRTILLKLFR